MLALFPLSNRLFARLLDLVFVLSLFHANTATNSTKRKYLSFKEKSKLTSNNYSAQIPAAAGSTKSPSHKPTEDNDSAKDVALQEYLRCAISNDSDALKDSALFLPTGVEMKLVDDMFQLKFSGYSMNYDDMTSELSYIHQAFKPFSLGSISLSNLPLSEINGSKIHEIMKDHDELNKFSMSNCFFDENEDKFYKNFPSLSLTELELSGCYGVEEILEKTQDSLQVLQLTNNSINLNFSQLTELLRKFTNLKKLTLDKNRIGIAGFEDFFEFVFSLKKLNELNLVNDGIVDPFLRLLSEREISSSLETLTLMHETKAPNYKNLIFLTKLELKTLCLTVSSALDFQNNFSHYLDEQKALESVICRYSSFCCSSEFKIPELTSDKNIIFDLSNFYYYSFSNLTTKQQLLNVTQLWIEKKQIENDLISLNSQVNSLPELRILTWSNDKIDPSLITSKSPNLEILRIDEKCSERLRSEGFFHGKRIFPSLVEFECHYPEKLQYNYENYYENDNFHEFFLANPSIKKLETNYCFLAVYVSDVHNSSQRMTPINSIEDIHISYDYNSDYSSLVRSLQFFPNVKKLDLFLNDHGDSVPKS